MNYLFMFIVVCENTIINGRSWFSATYTNYDKMIDSQATATTIKPYDEQENLRLPTNTSEYRYNVEYWPVHVYTKEVQKLQKNFTVETFPMFISKENNIFLNKSAQPSNGSSLQTSIVLNETNNDNSTNMAMPKFLNHQEFQWGSSRKSKKFNSFTGKGKFLEVFEVVKFDHDVCVSSSGLEGTCLHEYDCQTTGGSSMGSCADGIGTCCVMLYNCDTSSATHIGWFTNPNFPSSSSERLSCTTTIEKTSSDIKQLRLDFTNFELLPPSDGSCVQDQLLITGQDANNVIPILCGINTGHHMYIEVGNAEGPISLSIQTLNEENRLFSIKVTQIAVTDELAAPNGCLQYYKEDNGYLESFNYRDRSEIGIVRAAGYLNNLNYAICIDRAFTSCSITYKNMGEMQIVNYDNDGIPLIPPRQAGVEIYNCPSDWLLIAAVRLCGERLNDGSVLQDFALDAPVTDDAAGPITVWFKTDGAYAGRGFKLHYQQNSCSTAT